MGENTRMIARLSTTQTSGAKVGNSKLSPVYWRVIERGYEDEIRDKASKEIRIPKRKDNSGKPIFVNEKEYEIAYINYDAFHDVLKSGKKAQFEGRPIKDIDPGIALPEYVVIKSTIPSLVGYVQPVPRKGSAKKPVKKSKDTTPGLMAPSGAEVIA